MLRFQLTGTFLEKIGGGSMGFPNFSTVYRSLALSGLFVFLAVGPAWAETKLRVGALRLTSSAPLFIAAEKGYFADEGLNVE